MEMLKFSCMFMLAFSIQVMATDLDYALQQVLRASSTRSGGAIDPFMVRNLFELYNKEYHRQNRMGGDEDNRLAAFNDTVHAIRDHYQSGENMFSIGLNEFSDRTTAEMEQMRGLRLSEEDVQEDGVKPADNLRTWSGKEAKGRAALPTSYDLTRMVASGTTASVVRPIKSQDACGSCYAFAFVTLLEFQYAVQFNESRGLSEQQFVDCSPKDYGCNGGYITTTFSYLHSNDMRVNSEITYPYKAVARQCNFKRNGGGVRFGPLVYQKLTPRDAIAAQHALINYGPLYVSLFVGSNANPTYSTISRQFNAYKSGILSFNGCPTSDAITNHAVVIVGYGVDPATKTPYWKVRNSWGTGWGESGHFRIRRAVNMCGIESSAYFIARTA